MTKTLLSLLIILAALFPCVLSWADEPPLAPQRITISSAQKRYSAVSDPKSSETRVFRGLPSGQPGNNLLDRDYKPSDVLLQLYRDGKVVRTITVGEVIPDSKLLRETTSHWYWGIFEGFSQGKFWLKRQDGKRFSFE